MRHHPYMAATALALPLALGAASVQAADIVKTLEESGRFSTLVDAIEQAGVAEKLKGEGPYTVFAPTDAAFDKLPQDVRQQLMQEGEDGQLKNVLNHHVVEGKELAAKDVLGQETQVDTLSGDQLTVDGTGAVVVLVPTGLSVARVGDEVFVRREVGAMARPAVTVTTGEQQGQTATQQRGQTGQQQTGQQGEQQTGQQEAQTGQHQQGQQQTQTGQRGQRAQTGQQGEQQTGQQQQAQTGQRGQQAQTGQQEQQAGDQGQPMAEQQGVLRAAMVVEPDIQADNGVIHAIDQVLVPQKVEQKLAQGGGMQQQGQQQSEKAQQKTQ